jgi:cytochrome P450
LSCFPLKRLAKSGTSLAGSDTTATAIRATILYITTNPRVHSKLLAEISSASPSSPIQDVEARKLPYLQAVIKEGLRIFPPVTGLMTKDVPEGGDTINSLYIPEGTKIGYCAWGVFRDKKIWGEDSQVFRPERWLDGPPEKIRLQESTLELVFGYGRWQCLGKSVALIELNKIFVEVRVHNCDFNMSGLLTVAS